MHKTISLFAGLAALFAMGSVQAQVVCPTEPVYTDINDDTGHTYEIYSKNGITWLDAAACAQRPLGGAPGAIVGHLATVTSSSENDWLVRDLLNPALLVKDADNNFKLTQTQVWIGGIRDSTPGSLGWRWDNNEGPFPGVNNSTVFANWAQAEGEPNNLGGGENWVTLGRFSTNLAGWNDEGSAPGSIGGFIVEYDTPRALSQCVGTTTRACTTIDGQTLTFPAGSFDPGDSISFTAFEFNDPRVDPVTGKCSVSRAPLTLFEHLGTAATLTIPAYLCGSPRFLVVKVDSSDLNIIRGAVAVLNKTEVILPDNLFKCADPILNNPDANPDPQFQDVVVWQSTNPGLMLEQAGTGIYQGTATEATNGCGSTTGKVRTGSYFVVGMHIDFNLADAYPLNSEANYTQFVALTRYKLTLLRESIVDARLAGSLRPIVSGAMEALIAIAIYRLDRGNPAGALLQVNQFLQLVNAVTYTPITDANFNGDHLMRGENIAFTLRVKVIPFKPVP